jgi:hypothetical protein
MKMIRMAIFLPLALFSLRTTANDVIISSFDANGVLTFDEITNAASYRVEWTPVLSPSEWTNTWDALNNIPAAGSGSVTTKVPMFFRVVATVAQPVDLVITEIMYDPSVVTDIAGEWFELYNSGQSAIDLNGLIIESGGGQSHVISNGVPLMVGAGGHIVLGNNIDFNTNGNTPVAYQYSGITLLNVSDSLVIKSGAIIIDAVNYDENAGWPNAVGASIYLTTNNYNAVANDNAANWNISTVTYGSGDKGTPGQINEN